MAKSQQDTTSFLINRRSFLTASAAALGLMAFGEILAFAGTAAEDEFYLLSKSVTGHNDLNIVTAKRIYEALKSDDSAIDDKIHALNGAFSADLTPEIRLDIADKLGFKPLFLAITAAWYTGTVTTKAGPIVVAYKDALMYAIVADGLVVPTYGQKGPLYWQNTLPPGVSQMPKTHPSIL